jgi:hypothetical protein
VHSSEKARKCVCAAMRWDRSRLCFGGSKISSPTQLTTTTTASTMLSSVVRKATRPLMARTGKPFSILSFSVVGVSKRNSAGHRPPSWSVLLFGAFASAALAYVVCCRKPTTVFLDTDDGQIFSGGRHREFGICFDHDADALIVACLHLHHVQHIY